MESWVDLKLRKNIFWPTHPFAILNNFRTSQLSKITILSKKLSRVAGQKCICFTWAVKLLSYQTNTKDLKARLAFPLSDYSVSWVWDSLRRGFEPCAQDGTVWLLLGFHQTRGCSSFRCPPSASTKRARRMFHWKHPNLANWETFPIIELIGGTNCLQIKSKFILNRRI